MNRKVIRTFLQPWAVGADNARKSIWLGTGRGIGGSLKVMALAISLLLFG